MIRYACDCCKRELDPDMDVRYVVKLEVYPSFDPPLGDDVDVDERDHLQEIQEAITALESSADEPTGEDVYRKMHFDLCPECHARYVRNPLGRELVASLEFSNN
ncbi:MAG: hypothetical protein R3C10_22685 [Pirellulales bacterium]